MTFEYPTNYSGGEQVTGVWDFLIGYPSSILNGWYALPIILLIWVSFMTIFLVSGVRKAMAASSFITFILSGYFFLNGELNAVIPVTLIIMTIVGLLGAKEEQL